jgi:uncharacterized alpha-E superfamily protein
LQTASHCLSRLSSTSGQTELQSSFPARALGQLRARLEYSELGDLVDDLDQEMAWVQEVAAGVTAAVTTNYFAAEDPTAWITEGTR